VGSATVLLLQAYFSSGSALLVFSSTTTCLPTTDMSSTWLPLVAASSYGDSAGAAASLLPLQHRLLPPLLLLLLLLLAPLRVWANAASRSAEHSMSSSSSRMAHLRTLEQCRRQSNSVAARAGHLDIMYTIGLLASSALALPATYNACQVMVQLLQERRICSCTTADTAYPILYTCLTACASASAAFLLWSLTMTVDAARLAPTIFRSAVQQQQMTMMPQSTAVPVPCTSAQRTCGWHNTQSCTSAD
jgi:hypothetical protein